MNSKNYIKDFQISFLKFRFIIKRLVNSKYEVYIICLYLYFIKINRKTSIYYRFIIF